MLHYLIHKGRLIGSATYISLHFPEGLVGMRVAPVHGTVMQHIYSEVLMQGVECIPPCKCTSL